MLKTKVLVVGGGPSGSTAARFLSENSIDTILVERDFSYVKPCGGGIPSSALHELKIPEDVVKKRISKILIVSPKGQQVDVKLHDGYLAITERGNLDNRLRDLAKERGTRLIEAEFLRFEKIDKQIISIIKKKDSLEDIKIISDYVIASDGITFKTGSSLKLNKNDSIFTLSTHIKPAEGSFDHAEFWFSSQHASNFYSWVFPSKDFLSIGTGSKDAKALTNLLDKFIKRRFNTNLDSIRINCTTNKLRAFKIPEWKKNLFRYGNILFIGDAATTVMPVTYEGIYYGMKSGEFAATAIIENKPSLYKKLWDDRFKNRFLFMSKIKNYLFKDDENIERFVSIHKHPESQELAMRLWLRKETGMHALKSYIHIFKKLFFTF